MYGRLWRSLPGGLIGRLLGSVALSLVAVAVLFLVVFPRAEELLPFQNVTIDAPDTRPSPSSTPTGG